MNSGIIYCYKDIKRNQVVYVGQTINLKRRHYRHMEHDPVNELLREYHYPLSRAVRKYGKENYELIILEQNIRQEHLNQREVYFIEYYETYKNGYNQTVGGQLGKYSLYDDETINTVMEMLEGTFSYADIQAETGISFPHISNINTGKRCRKDDVQYPIRKAKQIGTQGRKLTEENVQDIVFMLQNTNISQKMIGEKYNVSQGAISKINLGKTNNNKDLTYPLR